MADCLRNWFALVEALQAALEPIELRVLARWLVPLQQAVKVEFACLQVSKSEQ